MEKHKIAVLAIGAVALVASMMYSPSANALPEGWTFSGTPGGGGLYSGPNDSFMYVYDHPSCP